MAGIVNGLGNIFHGGANAVRNAALTPEEIQLRNDGKRILEMIKVASIVAVIATLFLTAIFPNLFTIMLSATVAFAASEVYKAAENILEILNMAAVELVARSTKETLFNQVSKNTLVLGSLIRAIDPDVTQLILGQE